jgi:hypothetical protein
MCEWQYQFTFQQYPGRLSQAGTGKPVMFAYSNRSAIKTPGLNRAGRRREAYVPNTGYWV